MPAGQPPSETAAPELANSFQRLLNRQPTDAEKQHLYKVRDALGIRNNDALWLVLIALQYHQTLYKKFPDTIAASAKATLDNFKITADAVVKASAEAAKADLAKALERTSTEIASKVAGTDRAQWIAACAATITLCLGAIGWAAYSAGHEAGFEIGSAQGYASARDQKAADAWANTPEGQLAYRFAQTGELSRLARCDGKGWKASKGICYPYPAPDSLVYGWKLP